MKVAQLAGKVGEVSCYHHGEVSLQSTIVGMAQDFVGSNNINLLLPLGQFGSRLDGGDDHAQSRYIYSCLNKIVKKLFLESDKFLLKYLEDDGTMVEPNYYIPIIPMLLVNGCIGIGTGYSTAIPSYNPIDLINNIKLLLDEKEMNEITPW